MKAFKKGDAIWVADQVDGQLVVGLGRDWDSVEYRCYPDDGKPLVDNPRVKAKVDSSEWEETTQVLAIHEDWRDRLIGASRNAAKRKPAAVQDKTDRNQNQAELIVSVEQGGFW